MAKADLLVKMDGNKKIRSKLNLLFGYIYPQMVCEAGPWRLCGLWLRNWLIQVAVNKIPGKEGKRITLSQA